MPVRYDIYETPRKEGEEEISYHVRLLNHETITTERIANEIEYATSVTSGDVVSVFTSFSHLLFEHISQGKRVHLKGVGYFQLSASTPAVTDPKEIRAQHIMARTIKFTPEKKLKAKMEKIEFQKAKRKSLHSRSHTDESIHLLLEEYFLIHPFISRAEFQELCGLTRTTALRRIKQLLEQGILEKAGIKGSPVYVMKK